MKGIIYFLVIIMANTIGAISGMGGGVIIKPVLDFVGMDVVATVSFYSAVAVFTMSIVSTLRQIKNGVVIDKRVAPFLAIGSLVGGSVGNLVFKFLLRTMQNDGLVKLIQISLMLITLIFVLAYNYFGWKSFEWKAEYTYILCGFIAGFLSSLLGIGGGPINVSLLMLCFGMPIKLATVYSIIIIFAAQAANLTTIGLGEGFSQYDLSLLYFIVPGAIMGGIIGASLSKILPEAKVKIIFNVVVIGVICINVYNGWKLLG